MKALRMNAWMSEPVVEEVPTPEPAPGEVLVKVSAAGACHSDIHLMEMPPGAFNYSVPFTLGHEIAGTVEALGEGTTGYQLGEAVAVHGAYGCLRCRLCREGRENYCDKTEGLRNAAGLGLGLDGGMAEYVLVRSPRYLVPIGDLDPAVAAPLTDAGTTPYHAIRRSLDLLIPGSSAVVIGVGGLGHLAVQILKALAPVRVIAVDVSTEKLENALAHGADHVVEAGGAAVAEIKKITGDLGAELVLDFVGNNDTMLLGAQVARRLGHLTIVGLAVGFLNFSVVTVPIECSVASTFWGSIADTADVIELARMGRISVDVEKFSLENAMEAYGKMKAGELKGRAVITPNG
ncbi:MAG: alcohol dehydrogenase [Acidobacteria bacterium]|nr:MAG: alcohol dehydrogenase [Acidobacteriota bacterium]